MPRRPPEVPTAPGAPAGPPEPPMPAGPTAPALALDAAVRAVGDRWTLLVVDALLRGGRRYGELADAVPGIAPNVLAARLRHLEREGLVVATPYQRRPVRVVYELTAAGRDLAGALALLAAWGARRSGADDAHHHRRCGTPLETRAWCPTCEEPVDDADGDGLWHL